MSASIAFVDCLRRLGFTFYTGVPDSVLRGVCSALESRHDVEHLPAADEGAAVCLGIGWHLGTGEVPVVYLQNAGLWNALNPFFTLAHQRVYDIPILFIVGWRGRPGTRDEPQHAGGGETEDVLRMMGIRPFTVAGWDDGVAELAAKYLQGERRAGRSCALLVTPGVFDDAPAPLVDGSRGFASRREIVSTVLAYVSSADFLVGGIGHTARELYAQRMNSGRARAEVLGDFLCVGGMGYALQVAIGAALRRGSDPSAAGRVWCIEGDGAFLMHLGAAALVGRLQSLPLVYVLLDNGAHASVGGQRTACQSPDYAAAARALGFGAVESASCPAEAKAGLGRIIARRGPQFLWIRIRNEPNVRLPRPGEPLVDRKQASMDRLREQGRSSVDERGPWKEQ